jgi:ribosome-binding protein aMBF1 (putative translation factor)
MSKQIMLTHYLSFMRYGLSSYMIFYYSTQFCLVTDKDKEYLARFGANLKSIRESKGFTQAQLAIDCNLDLSYISRIENGRISPSLIYIRHIAEALNIETKQLLVS